MKQVNHIAFMVSGSKRYAEQAGIALEQAYAMKFSNVYNCIDWCTAREIPAMTFLLLPGDLELPGGQQYVGALTAFVSSLRKSALVNQRGIRFQVYGHWYNLPSTLVDEIKALLEQTKDYDAFFCNLCLAYDGKQEMVDAVRLIAHQVKAGKLDPDGVDEDMIKESLYTSGIVPPDVIVKTGSTRKLRGFMLWDSADADIHITGKPWQDFCEKELDMILKQ
jgi:tritrans,polycis-undecaprenyl-diphosphate synthase [geranylgeranyl-diphosphate specific]